MVIKNFEQLASTALRKQALLIAESGLVAIETNNAVHRAVSYDSNQNLLAVQGRVYSLVGVERVLVVGFGKAAFEAVDALYEILGTRIDCGYVLDLKGGSRGNLTCTIGSHPFPTLVNVEATKQIVEVTNGLTEKDLLICVVSGGGSSLLCYPYKQSCEVQTSIVSTLMQKGANIHELNTVRKHISLVKGGQLAQAAYPAQVINLVFSDVPGDELAMVASGPTMPDTTTVHDAAAVLRKYDVLNICALPRCELQETPKDEKYFKKVSSHLVVSAGIALEAMRLKAEDLGFKTRIYKAAYAGEARELAKEFALEPRVGECVLAAGESTVTVAIPGKGGRNLELALAASQYLQTGQVLIACDSDGFDNTNFAGALVDESTLARASHINTDPLVYLNTNASYSFFEQLGDHIDTGLTGSNVADFVVSLRE
jgi:glycerate 2-kinase